MKTVSLVGRPALVLGALLFAAGYAGAQEPYPPRSCALIQLETHYPKVGRPRLKTVRCRWVDASGQWKELSASLFHEGGIVNRVMLSNREGQYSQADAEGGSLRLLRPGFAKLPEVLLSPQFLRSDQEFDREYDLLGYRTLLKKFTHYGQGCTEQHHAPAVGAIPVMLVLGHGDGSRTVIEPVRIELGTVAEEVMTGPALPLRLDLLKQVAEDLEQGGSGRGRCAGGPRTGPGWGLGSNYYRWPGAKFQNRPSPTHFV